MRAAATAAVELGADLALLACSSLWDLYKINGAATGRHVECTHEVSMFKI